MIDAGDAEGIDERLESRIGDGGENSHPAATLWTAKRIDLEDALKEFGPGGVVGPRLGEIDGGLESSSHAECESIDPDGRRSRE